MSNPIQLYIAAHNAAWYYEQELGRKMTHTEFSTFFKEYMASAQEI
jgi:hypothetical protein